MTTQEDIRRLSLDHSVIRHAVTSVDLGLISWDQAMMDAVSILVRINQEQERLLIDMFSRFGAPLLKRVCPVCHGTVFVGNLCKVHGVQGILIGFQEAGDVK